MMEDGILPIARLLLAAVYFVSAIDKVRLIPEEVEAIRALPPPAPASLERLAGMCEVVGVVMLGLGPASRVAAILLALFTPGVTLAFLGFRSVDGPKDVSLLQSNTFFGNRTMIGALSCVAVSGPGALVQSRWGWSRTPGAACRFAMLSRRPIPARGTNPRQLHPSGRTAGSARDPAGRGGP